MKKLLHSASRADLRTSSRIPLRGGFRSFFFFCVVFQSTLVCHTSSSDSESLSNLITFLHLSILGPARHRRALLTPAQRLLDRRPLAARCCGFTLRSAEHLDVRPRRRLLPLLLPPPSSSAPRAPPASIAARFMELLLGCSDPPQRRG